MNDKAWKAIRQEAAHRTRRIIYNDDGDARYSRFFFKGKTPPSNEEEFLAGRFGWVRDTQVGSIFWCIGDGQEVPWGLPQPEGIEDCTRTMLDAARAAGMEAVITLRMNDTHDAFGTLTYPFKLEHRDLLIDPAGERGEYAETELLYYLWSAMDYAFEEVRDHKFDYISQVCENYVPDGFELDFFRHPAYFKEGEEAANLPVMTDFVRRVRARLDEIGQQHGRPILLMARLADTPEKSIAMGLDGPTWIEEGLLDVLIIGGGYAPYCGAWKVYRDLAHRHDLPAYPCFNCSLVSHAKSLEMLRGVAATWWHEGTDGIYLFNPFVPVDGGIFSAEAMYAELSTVGDPQTLVGLDKLFCQDHVEDMTWTSNIMMDRMTASAPLPTTISTTPTAIPLLVADDLRTPPNGMKLELRTDPPEASSTLAVRVNEQSIADGRASGEWLELSVGAPPLRQGINDVSVALSAGDATLNGLRLWVCYRDE